MASIFQFSMFFPKLQISCQIKFVGPPKFERLFCKKLWNRKKREFSRTFIFPFFPFQHYHHKHMQNLLTKELGWAPALDKCVRKTHCFKYWVLWKSAKLEVFFYFWNSQEHNYVMQWFLTRLPLANARGAPNCRNSLIFIPIQPAWGATKYLHY